MSNVLVNKDKIDILANAISIKSGEPLKLTLDEMVEAVDGIDTSGGGGITPTGNIDITQAGTTDVTNYATATVPQGQMYAYYSNNYATVSGVRKWKLTPVAVIESGDGYGTEGYIADHTTEYGTEITYNAVASGTTVTPTTSSQTIGGANYMMEGAVTVSAMPSGTAGTPTATKGSVSNHSVSVTPSVTNTTGYITGSTKTGTAVTVSASELVSGSETKTANGTYDVTNLAELVVNVSGGGTPMGIGGEEAELTTTSNSITFTNLVGEPTSFYIYYEDSISPSATSYVSALVFDGTTIHGQTITNVSNAQATYNGSSFTKSYSNGTLTITSTNPSFISGWYDIVYSYGGGTIDTKDVQVGSGATSITFTGLEDEPAYWSCIFKSNFGTSSGYQRVIWTGSNQSGTGVYGASLDSSTHMSSTFWTASYNNGSLTITSQGTNQGGYFHQPGYYQLTYAYDDGSSGNYQSKTVTPTTSQQVVEADSGYDALKKVAVNAIPSEYIVPSGNINITSNTATGQTLNVAQYATATVAVPSSGSSKNAQVVQGTTRTTSSTLTAIGAEMTVSKTGTYDVYWSAFRSSTSSSYTYGTQLYIDGSAHGTQNTTWSNHVQNNHLTNVSLTQNQKIRVYGRNSRGSSYYIYAPTLLIVEA